MNTFEQKLGAALVKEGVISDDILRTAERRQLENGGRIDTNLLELGTVDPGKLIDLLARAANCEAATLTQLEAIDEELIRGFPARLALRYRIIPFLKERRTLHIIMNDPLDLSLIEEISFLLNVPLRPHVVPEAWLEHALHKYYGIETHDRFLRLFDEKWGRPSEPPPADAAAPEVVPAAPVPLEPPVSAAPENVASAPVPSEAPVSATTAPSAAPPPAGAAALPEKPYAYPRDFALRDIDAAGSRDEILAAALKFFWQHFEFSAVFAVTGGRVKGWGCAGGLPEAAAFLKSFSAPLEEPSVFRIMYETKSHYLGPLAPTAINDEIRESLGRPSVPNILLIPIAVKGRLVAAVYSDNGAAPVESHVIPDLVAFSAGVAGAFSELIIKKKQGPKAAATKAVPQAAAPAEEPPPPVSAVPVPVPEAPLPAETPAAAEPAAAEPAAPPVPVVEAAGAAPAEAPADIAAPAAHADEIVTAPVPIPVLPPEPEAHAAPARDDVPAFDAAALEDMDRALEVPPPVMAGEVRRPDEPEPPRPDLERIVSGGQAEEEDAHLAAVERVERVDVAGGVTAPGEQAAGAAPPEAGPPGARSADEIGILIATLEASGRGVLDDSFTALQEIGEACIPVLAKRFPGRLRIDPLSQTQRDVAEVEEHSDLIRLIIAIGRPCVEMLCELTRDADTNKRFYAVFTFSKLRYPEAIPFLLDRIFDSSPKVRLIALDVLHRFRSFPKFAVVTSRLRSELAGGDTNRQRIAAIALGQFKDVESIPQLIKLTGSRDEDVAEAAVQALVDLAKQNFGDSERKWMAWWRDNKDVPRVRWLIEGLKHKEEEIRFMAVEELRELTGNFFSYFHDAPKKDREKSIERWEAWYKDEYQPKK
ncbi:MAG: hypothetical protein HY897_12325 [Deltaproteobacteria bacterium]|nr:hypothetical protein [Deltaproteobacteria bacterium]